jgi:hypothetical protein
MAARFGPVFRCLLDAMAPAVRTLIDRGNPVIFDHVLHDHSMYESYLAASAGLDVFTVGVTCPLDVLEMRERARGDRVLGRARGLAQVVHTFCTYDTMVDTGTMTAEACMKAVLDAQRACAQFVSRRRLWITTSTNPAVTAANQAQPRRARALTQRSLPGASLLKDVAPRGHQHHNCRHNQKRRLSCGTLQKTGTTVLITLHCHGGSPS